MTLRDLEGTFQLVIGNGHRRRVGDARPTDVHGVMFLCPKCYVANGGRVGTHMVAVLFAQAPGEFDQDEQRWTASGAGLDDLTLTPSIEVVGGCGWHGFVTNGDAS